MRANGSLSVALGSVLAFSLVHCGSDGGGPPNLNAFLGTWSCDSTTTINVSGMPQQKATTMVTLEVTKSGTNTVTIGEMGDSTCAAEIRIAGTSGTLASGFTCDQGGLNIKVQSAQVRASGDKLTGSRNASVSGMSDSGEAYTGTMTNSIECTRLSGPPDADGGAGKGTGNTGAGAKAGSGGNTGSGASPATGARPGSGGNDDAGTGGGSGSGGSGGGGTGSGGKASGGTGSGGKATGGSGGGVTPPVDCSAEADCGTCCDDNFPAGVTRLDQLLLDCACGACATECATSLCATTPSTPQQGDDCDVCVSATLDPSGECLMSTADACTADKTCAQYVTCLGSCP